MQFFAVQKSLTEAECDVLIVNLFEGVKTPGGGTGAVDKAVNGAITALIEREGFEAKLGQVSDLTPSGDIKAPKIILVGLGKQDEFDVNKVRIAASAAAKRAKSLSAKHVATILHGAGVGGMDPAVASRALVEGTILGTYEFTKHRTTDVKPNPIQRVDIVETDANKAEAIKSGIQVGEITANAKNYARDLTNEPGNVVTPSYLADQAEMVANETGLDCRVISRAEMKQIGMRLLLAVSKGSAEEPKFIALRYTAPKATRTVAIVGKGITFDSGGLNIKVGDGMAAMKDDMTGAGVVLATMKAVAQLKPNVNVLGLMPACENMPSGTATRPGDVVVGLSGKTVEINNTDAEGRLILADAVAFAEREGVDEIIDIATLTGGCVIALGRSMAGLFGTDQATVDKLIKAGTEGGEPLWQLPFYADYEEGLKSDVADMKNTASREASAITGGLFIKMHVKDTPYVHIDIAGPCSLENETPIGPKGGTGFGVATLVNYLLEQ